MIYLETTIIVQPGKANEYMEAEKAMYPMMAKFGVKVVGSWHTVIGDTNEYTVLFAYENMGQLEKVSMAMMQDKEYQATFQKMEALLVSQSRKIMMVMPSSPLR
jgi:hypothetical protein